LKVEIDPNDLTLGTNQPSHKEADTADAATHIEHSYAARNPSRKQHPFRKGPRQLGLFDQPVVLGARTTKRIIGVVHQASLRSIDFGRSAAACVSASSTKDRHFHNGSLLGN